MVRVLTKDLICGNTYFLDACDLTGESEIDKKCLKLLKNYQGEANFFSSNGNVLIFKKGDKIFTIFNFDGEYLIPFNKKYESLNMNDISNEVYFTITFGFYK